MQKRIDASYIDKIDGRISEAFWRDQTDKWLNKKEDATFDGKVLEFTLRNFFDTMRECRKTAKWGGINMF